MDAVTVACNSYLDLDQLLSCQPLRDAFDRLIVVDNASTDGSLQLAQQGGAEVVAVDSRRGYGACVNVGARHTRGPYFAVINPDITFDEVEIAPRLERQLDNPVVGIAAPALVLPDGRLQDSARQMPTLLDIFLRRRLSPERGAIRMSGEVPWVVGACFVMRRDAWLAIGGFDEQYFLYFEDVDLCWRMRQAGWSIVIDHDVRVYHRHNRESRGSLFGFATRQHIRSAVRFYRRNPRFIITRRIPRQAPWQGHKPVTPHERPRHRATSQQATDHQPAQR